MTSEVIKKQRYEFIDTIRGIAVILMIFFHLFYDLNIFKFVTIDFSRDPFWYYLPRLIVTLFLFAVGNSMALAHGSAFKKSAFIKRQIKVGLGALAITIFTYFAFPKNWVYFGTLHCIFFCSLLCLVFLKRRLAALILGIIILTLEFSGFGIPFFELPHASMDYIELFPWVAVSFIGLYSFDLGIHKISVPGKDLLKPVNFLGRHAFFIYLIHQPVLYTIVYLIRFLGPK